MTISLSNAITHPSDTQARLSRCGLNFDGNRVMFRVTLVQTGETRDYFVGSQPGDIDSIAGLIAEFPGFANLKNNLEEYLAEKVAALGGDVT